MSVIISLAALIVFFVAASNISTLVQLGRTNMKQNEEIIRLLGGGKPSERPKEAKEMTAKEILAQAKARAYK